jgi:hypothetical protein
LHRGLFTFKSFRLLRGITLKRVEYESKIKEAKPGRIFKSFGLVVSENPERVKYE